MERLAFENRQACIQRISGPGLTASIDPLAPGLKATEPAFNGAGLHCISAGQNCLQVTDPPKRRQISLFLISDRKSGAFNQGKPPVISRRQKSPDLNLIKMAGAGAGAGDLIRTDVAGLSRVIITSRQFTQGHSVANMRRIEI